MKRTVSILLTFALMLTLAACGSTENQNNTSSDPAPEENTPAVSTPETPSSNQPEDTATPENETPADTETTDDSGNKILIAYFSATSNTENIANHLNEILEADLYEIVPETPYTSDDLNYSDSSTRATREQNDDSARPAISGSVENIEQYDTIFLGYPIWWGQAPKIMYTFVESYDLSGKTIVPFCTSGSSPMGSSAANLPVSADNAVWLEGQRFSGGASVADVQSWVDGLPLNS